MIVTVEGVITSIEQDTRKGTEGNPDRHFTKILLAQKGEKVQTEVRIPGHVEEKYSIFEVAQFTGNLLAWRTRDGVGMMVNVDEQ